MTLTRRAFSTGSLALAAASAAFPARSDVAPPALHVRRSIKDLTREGSPIIESYRRAVDVMMKREVTDKTSWWFQANIHDLPETEKPQHPSLMHYWHQCPHENYFFLSWHRMYLYFFERIVRKASGDPSFALPYWGYDDPLQAALPVAFVPTDEELGDPPKVAATPYMSRKNPLARAKRLQHVDHRWMGLGDVSRDASAALALDKFTADDKLDAQRAFGGVRTNDPHQEIAAGGIEFSPHNLIHRTIGLQGDMGEPETAARDPIFWLHHANIDRLWVRWTDPARGRAAPVADELWMNKKFVFVDEDGNDREMSGADVLDTQHQLGYRYDDDPPRPLPLEQHAPVVASAPGTAQGGSGARGQAPQAIVVAASSAIRLDGRDNHIALSVVAPQAMRGPAFPGPSKSGRGPMSGRGPSSGAALETEAPSAVPETGSTPPLGRLRVVLKDVIAPPDSPPYDVLLVAGKAAGAGVRLGSLALFGGGMSEMDGSMAHGNPGATVVFEATQALAELAGQPGFDLQNLSVAIRRRGFSNAAGEEFVPPDPNPPRIGSIDLLRS